MVKTFIFSFGILFIAMIPSVTAQTSSSLHPFIRWEIEQIARIDSLWAYSKTHIDARDSGWDPYFRREEGRLLLDSIPNLKIESHEDVVLELTALDTLMYSDLSNVAHAEWEYNVMDHLLNTVYKLAMKTTTEAGKIALKADEIQWLKKRDAYFKKVERKRDRDEKAAGGGNMWYQIAAEEQTDFVRERVLYLAGKLKSVR